jgi:hypothetical protein
MPLLVVGWCSPRGAFPYLEEEVEESQKGDAEVDEN